jgi:glycosyltransferase involved in cell wall biosynthesis
MKVCLLTTSFPRFSGDYAGVFVYDLATWLTRLGVEVRVVAPGEANVPKREVMGGIDVWRFNYMIPRRWQRIAYLGGIPANLQNSWLARFQLPFFLLSFLATSLRACRECDVIHAYWILAGFVGSLVSKLGRKPVVLTVQGSDINAFFENGLLRRFREYVIRRVHRVIAVSRPLAERVKLLGANADKVQLIPNGVDPAVFGNGGGMAPFNYRLLWVGRLSPEKGVEHLIRAMSAVVARFPQATLRLVGDGPSRAQVEQLILELGLGMHVRLEGMVCHDQVPEYHRETDVFVLPSLSEGLPLALVEAMSAGRPVVATRVGGIPDVVISEGQRPTGSLVPPGDAQALAEAISALLRCPEEARLMGENGRIRVKEQFAWSSIAQQTEAVYRSLL